jgi:hypothetical protein
MLQTGWPLLVKSLRHFRSKTSQGIVNLPVLYQQLHLLYLETTGLMETFTLDPIKEVIDSEVVTRLDCRTHLLDCTNDSLPKTLGLFYGDNGGSFQPI